MTSDRSQMPASAGDRQVEFTSPPVKAVTLTVHFVPVEDLQVTHLLDLLGEWRREYPFSQERPPLSPLTEDDSSSVDILRGGESWPFPNIAFSRNEGEDVISLQSDRLSLTWQFREGRSYPGFETLRGDLHKRFSEFDAAVAGLKKRRLALVGAECYYVNTFPNYSPEQLAIGILSGWSARLDKTIAGAKYAGSRVFFDEDPTRDDCTVLLVVDGEGDGESTFGIVVSYTGDGSAVDESMGGLDRAHGVLIDTFVEHTTEVMHKEWGRIQ